ncbi:MAG: low-specificity L-threonine aldolase [Kiritimatiellae bacterium]|nr:low-specificity L-threonine aldolase [Kiritimatiellia bacterium]
MKLIDLRSDTVTRPTPAMRRAMAEAEVGDDVYGEDPTVNRLEAMAAEMLGKEAALFTTSGTQSNLIAILCHCMRGDEFIIGRTGHSYLYEGGGSAIVGGIQPCPLDFEPDGTLDLEKVRASIKPDNVHFVRTKLLCLENTQNGKALPPAYLDRVGEFLRIHGLKGHLDGARLFNASVKLGLPVATLAKHFDSVSVCLSKGLGAPVGSLLCSTREFVREARRWRKVLGGGMRQAGVLAAAGIYALTHHVERLAEDHANAELLARELSAIDALEVEYAPLQTNMVFVSLREGDVSGLIAYLRGKGILLLAGKSPLRLVTHLDVTRDDILMVICAFREYFARS